MGTKFTITMKQEVFHTLELDVDDYIKDAGDIKETCDLYHTIANDPLGFILNQDHRNTEAGEVSNVSIDVSEMQ